MRGHRVSLPKLATLQEPTGNKSRDGVERTEWMHSEYLLGNRLCPPLPPAVEGTEARGAADRDRNRPTDKEPTAALPTDGL